jgi:hypothetical protein
MNHTPGPWRTSREDMESFTQREDGAIDNVVYIYRGDQPRIPVFGGELDNARADARLMASSPNLLKAAKLAMDRHCRPDPLPDEVYEALEAAIAAAEGGGK